MSDYILKFWPTEEVSESKTVQIENDLHSIGILGERTEFWGKAAFKPGSTIHEYLEPLLERNNPYFDTIAITVSENDYGVKMGSEDFEYIDRKNVISIKGGEGGFDGWGKMCQVLNEITGNPYEGGWELL